MQMADIESSHTTTKLYRTTHRSTKATDSMAAFTLLTSGYLSKAETEHTLSLSLRYTVYKEHDEGALMWLRNLKIEHIVHTMSFKTQRECLH